jgi:phosphate transport system permease protein
MAASGALTIRPALGLGRRRVVDEVMSVLFMIATAIAVAPLLLVVGYIVVEGARGLNVALVTQLPAPVGEPGGGMGNAFVGSAIVIAIASAIALPVGILAGVYLSEFGHGRFGDVLRFFADVLTGVPSIVVGIVAYTILVVPLHSFSALSGGFALSIIMIPTVTRTTEEALTRVPTAIREASLALGVREWKTILRVVIPTGLAGIITGAMLAIARISGETAPLLFTAFGSSFWQEGLLRPIAAVPLQVFQYAISPYKDWHEQAWAAALILMLLVLGLNIGIRLVTRTGFRTVR